MNDKWSPREVVHRDYSSHPPAYAPGYKTSVLRSPKNALISLQNSLSEITGPVFSRDDLGPLDNDLILNYAKEGLPIGERIIVHGYVRDGFGRPMKNTLVEVWQANAGGRYRHKKISIWRRLTRTLAAAAGCLPMKTAITVSHHQTGPYPRRSQASDWRPAHIHFSLSGDAWAQRLITQMYFEGDPLIKQCPIVRTINNDDAVRTLIAELDMHAAVPLDCLAYRFDLVLRGHRATLFENRTQGAAR